MRIRTLLIALLLSPAVARSAPESNAFRLLEPGLELGELAMPVQSTVGDSRLLVLRIDPEHFELRLLNASAAEQKAARSAREWSAEAGLTDVGRTYCVLSPGLSMAHPYPPDGWFVQPPVVRYENTITPFSPNWAWKFMTPELFAK